MAVQKSHKYRTQLYEILVRYFNMGELRVLSFSLDVDFDILSGNQKSEKALELITYLERRKRLPELSNKIEQERPELAEELRNIRKEMKSLRQKQTRQRQTWYVAGSVLLAIAIILIVALWQQQDAPDSAGNFIYQVRIRDNVTNSAVENARVTLGLGGDVILPAQYTDVGGLAVFSIKTEYANDLARLSVEKTGYRTDTHSVNIIPERLPQEIHLQPVP